MGWSDFWNKVGSDFGLVSGVDDGSSYPYITQGGSSSSLQGDSSQDLSQQLIDLINGMFDTFQNNQQLYQDVKDTNIVEAEKAFERQKQLMDYQYELEKKMRSTQMQDTIEDLKKAGINPSVYFSQGGSSNSSFGITSGSVNSASVNNPSSDTLSSLVNAYSSVLASIASNKNADTAVLRSVIGALGSIFSVNKSSSSSQSLIEMLYPNEDDRYKRSKIGF